MKTKQLLFMLAALGFVACSHNEDLGTFVPESEIPGFKFETLKSYQAKNVTRSADYEVVENDNQEEPEEITIIICSWDGWGRTSRNCTGFGLCHFEWFPNWKSLFEEKEERGEMDESIITEEVADDPFVAEVKEDTLGNRYMDIVLAEPIGASNISNMPSLNLDTDVFSENPIQNDSLETYLVLKQGTYEFDPSLGSYGGYRVDVEK